MKNKQYLWLLIFGISSCTNPSKQVDKTVVPETERVFANTDYSKYYTQEDTLSIITERGDTLQFAKDKFNNIIDEHPELFREIPDTPDQAYFNNDTMGEFGSEVGQDNYYVLYAYFLKQRNGVEEFAQQRQKLIDIYSNINSLFGHFEYGGTYFGHQYSRILGYAEYSIYLLPKTKARISKTYDITKQKALYIQSLRQLIEDENKIDSNMLGEDTRARMKELNEIVDELDRLMTDNFYLRRAQEFHYGHYEYY
jgi:hypothetical protein